MRHCHVIQEYRVSEQSESKLTHARKHLQELQIFEKFKNNQSIMENRKAPTSKFVYNILSLNRDS